MNEIYRDPTDGAAARRHDLLGRRRDELVMMPHAIRRVVVARWARIVGSLAAWLGGEAMVIAAVSPAVAAWVALAGLVASVAMTRRAARLPIAAPFAAVAALAAAAGSAIWWWLVGPAAIALTIALVVRRLRIERDRIQAEDPAAGSEMFTLR